MENEFEREWHYDFEYWKKTIGFEPVELVYQKIGEEYYSTNRGHVFKLKNGKYASVIEMGCSCYTPDEAIINFYEDKEGAMNEVKRVIED